MTVSSVRGIAKDIATRRQDAVIPGTTTNSARNQAFQQKLASASKQVKSTSPNAIAQRSTAMQSNTKTEGPRSTPTHVSVSAQTMNRKHIDTRGLVQAQELAARALAARKRIRQFKKTTPKELRKTVFQITKDQGLSLVDIWSNNKERSVTLIVDQPGYSRTKFVIDYEDSMWQVEIRADLDSDTESLVAGEEALKTRFDAAELGLVNLAENR